jgi:hypothetical protein
LGIHALIYNRSQRYWRSKQGIAVSILFGVAFFFTLPFLLAPVYTASIWIFLPTLMSCYFAAGLTLGLFWPQLSWRVGLWLFLVWPPMLLFALFLAADAGPWNWKGELISLGEYALMMIAACIGGWLGSTISKR